MVKRPWFALSLLLIITSAGYTQTSTPAAQAARTLDQRIGHTDPAKANHLTAVHDGPGSMDFRPLLGLNSLDTNLIFFHRGVIQPKSGIGQHFHNKCEEMFVILDGEAEFTVDGHTSLVKGPAGVPDVMGHAHAIYNPTDKPVQWLNINVGLSKTYDAFNLGDPRLGVNLDPIPQFMTMHLDRALLKPIEHMEGGTGTVQYRRALAPSVFSTVWSYVDHLVIPPGSSVGPVTKAQMSEVYYVLSGAGEARIGTEKAAIQTGDAIPVRLNEEHSFTSSGNQPLEFMIVGVAKDFASKDALMNARR
ncbi:cupin domain-containing protein [Terriglobus albidus]|uniref:cupin domain-containing protein n=1 Tax=Terriglobus albidus TaxID=1592106 RepID=UPI0021DF607A|nr:cupin domain-containing protein [Terriglobus albidus]